MTSPQSILWFVGVMETLRVLCDLRNGFLNVIYINPLNAELNPIYHLLALLGAHRIFHVGRIRVNFIYLNFIMEKILYFLGLPACELTQSSILCAFR